MTYIRLSLFFANDRKSTGVSSSKTQLPAESCVQDSIQMFADCLGAETWLSAAIPYQDSVSAQKQRPITEASTSLHKDSMKAADLLYDALLAEREDRLLWRRNRLEQRHFFATYEVLDDPNLILAFAPSSDGHLRGSAFLSSSSFSHENLLAFRTLFNRVVSEEGRKEYRYAS